MVVPPTHILSVFPTQSVIMCSDLSSATVQRNIELAARVRELERELQVWKVAHTASQDEVERCREGYQHAEGEVSGPVKAVSTITRPLAFSHRSSYRLL